MDIEERWKKLQQHLDPNDLVFNVVSCEDVGVECGGWGRILMKIRVEGPELEPSWALDLI